MHRRNQSSQKQCNKFMQMGIEIANDNKLMSLWDVVVAAAFARLGLKSGR